MLGAGLVVCADHRALEVAKRAFNTVRGHVANKAIDMRRQGFVGTAMLPMSELEYTGIAEKLKALDKRFAVRTRTPVPATT